MKKTYFWLFMCIAVIFGGCSSKSEPKPEKQEANVTQKQEGNISKQKTAEAKKTEVNKTIKRTNITVNNFSDCPLSAPSDYKTIPYE